MSSILEATQMPSNPVMTQQPLKPGDLTALCRAVGKDRRAAMAIHGNVPPQSGFQEEVEGWHLHTAVKLPQGVRRGSGYERSLT